MSRPGSARGQLASTLTAAYGDGLLSEATFVRRLDALFAGGIVEPGSLVGDISRRPARGSLGGRLEAARGFARRAAWSRRFDASRSLLLSLDWHGGREELTIGRHPSCDVVVPVQAVSRRHAALSFRDGKWILRDLGSRNGTLLNGTAVARCELRPGDVLAIGGQRLRVD